MAGNAREVSVGTQNRVAGAQSFIRRSAQALHPGKLLGPGIGGRLFLAVFVAIGVITRFRALLAARSLWLDEVSLAMSVREVGLFDLLTQPLAFGQSAPPGFLVASKFSAQLFGTGLVWIRMVPFVSGVLLVLVAALFAGRAFAKPAARIAFVAAVSMSPTLIFYSAEMKQYSTDAFAVMLALYLSTRMLDERVAFVAAVAGLFAVTSSLPGLIVFGFLGLLILVEAFSKQGLPGLLHEIRSRWIVYGAWTSGAVIHLAYTLVAGTDRARMRVWWGDRGGFAPENISGVADFSWYVERFIELFWLAFENTRMVGPSTRRLEPLVIVAVIVLIVLAIRGRRRSLLTARLLAAVLLGAWLLAEFNLYPLSSRLAVYLIPVCLALLAMGLDGGLRASTVRDKSAALAALLILASGQIPSALRQYESPFVGIDMHGVLDVLNREISNVDAVVTNPLGERIIDWHRPGRSFLAPVVVIDPNRILEDVNDVLFEVRRPERVWIVTTHRVGEAKDIAAALAEEYRYFSEFDRGGTYIALVSERGPIAFAETGDRQLLSVLTAELGGP